MSDVEKIICPKCDKETVKGEKCTLCQFALDGFSQFMDWQETAEKVRKKKEEKAAADAAAANPPKKKTFLSHLGGK